MAEIETYKAAQDAIRKDVDLFAMATAIVRDANLASFGETVGTRPSPSDVTVETAKVQSIMATLVQKNIPLPSTVGEMYTQVIQPACARP